MAVTTPSIGRMRRRLVLEAPVETDDGAGGVVRTFEAVATLWAAVEPLSAGQSFETDRLGQIVTHRITLRFRDGITTLHRFRDGTRIHQIRSAFVSGEDRFLVTLTEEFTS